MLKPNPLKNISQDLSPESQLKNQSLLKSLVILHFLGYGMFVLWLFDLAQILYPFNLFDSTWEFETFGQLVEVVAIPFISLGFIFCGGINGRYIWEKLSLKILSWLTLLIAICYLILIPLSISNTLRLNKTNNTAIATQENITIEQIVKAEEALATINTSDQMQAYMSYFKSLPASITESTELNATKEQLAKLLQSEKISINSQATNQKIQQRNALLRKSLKWNLGALIASILFLIIWRETSWIRNHV